jgi:hypothetical protein
VCACVCVSVSVFMLLNGKTMQSVRHQTIGNAQRIYYIEIYILSECSLYYFLFIEVCAISKNAFPRDV